MKVLILGATGMLGNAFMRSFYDAEAGSGHTVYGTVRSSSSVSRFPAIPFERFVTGVDVENHDTIVQVILDHRPDIVINCVGLVKQRAEANDPLIALPVNALLPHRLSRLCALAGARFIHFSTDCVFSGAVGNYRETDTPDATDLYGRSKLLGEVHDAHALTIRTSIIGRELAGHQSLIDWFLLQKDRIKGYRNAIFSGLPTVEHARIVIQHVLPRPELSGLYNVAAKPISKYDLLTLVAAAYGKDIEIEPCDEPRIDRSLDGTRFAQATDYKAPEWPELVRHMRDFQ